MGCCQHKQNCVHLRHRGRNAVSLTPCLTFWSGKWQCWHGSLFQMARVFTPESLLYPVICLIWAQHELWKPVVVPVTINRPLEHSWGPGRGHWVTTAPRNHSTASLARVSPYGAMLKTPLKRHEHGKLSLLPTLIHSSKGHLPGS
jgi:hypothetical protein